MADITPRFAWDNLPKGAGVIMTVTSEAAGTPKEYILDPLRARRYRSAFGWTIVDGFNHKLDFTEGTSGDASAFITLGAYATGALMAAEIETRINAAATDNTYTVTYNGSNKFVIARDTGADTFGLEWDTGANTDRSIGEDIGFDVSADKTGLTTYTSDTASYQSRQFIKFDLIAADTVQFAAILDHNLHANGTIKIQGHTVDTAAGWESPDVDENLDQVHAELDSYFRLKFITSASKRYWRFLINNTQSSDGFIETSLVHISPILEPDRDFAFVYTKARQELTSIFESYQGVVWSNKKSTRPSWSLSWLAVSEATRISIELMLDTVTKGGKFFFGFDPQNDQGETEYVYLPQEVSFKVVPLDKWAMDMVLNREVAP